MQNEGKKSKTPHTKIISVGMGRRRRKKRFACVINVRPAAAAAATLYSVQETKRHLYSYIFTAGDGGEVVAKWSHALYFAHPDASPGQPLSKPLPRRDITITPIHSRSVDGSGRRIHFRNHFMPDRHDGMENQFTKPVVLVPFFVSLYKQLCDGIAFLRRMQMFNK